MNLQDIRTSVRTYLDMGVTVQMSVLTSVVQPDININEEFTFSVTVTNVGTAALGVVALKNVRYHIWVDNSTVGRLLVPAAPMVVRSGYLPTNPVISPTPAPQYSSNMYLFPSDEKNYLDQGESDIITLRGKAGTTANAATNVRFEIFAEIDMDFLFPKNENTVSTTRLLAVL